MSSDWSNDVAALLVEAGQALERGRPRRAGQLVATALAVLERLDARGDAAASELLQQFRATSNATDDRTERFRFAPGELEALSERRPSPPPPRRSRPPIPVRAAAGR